MKRVTGVKRGYRARHDLAVDSASHGMSCDIEADQEVHIAEQDPSDPSYDRLWGLHNADDHDIDAPEAWARARGDNGFVVAVIDTGVDYNHPDLVNSMWVNTGEVRGQSGMRTPDLKRCPRKSRSTIFRFPFFSSVGSI